VGDARSCAYVDIVLKECLDVAAAAGVTIAPFRGVDSGDREKFTTTIKTWLSTKHYTAKASMLQDLLRGKKTEVDSINGVVAEWGDRYGVATPLCRQIVAIIHRLENGGRPCIENLSLFD
jgi:2-dehydropantoate 2-reductase